MSTTPWAQPASMWTGLGYPPSAAASLLRSAPSSALPLAMEGVAGTPCLLESQR
jgi:hypothetical protein